MRSDTIKRRTEEALDAGTTTFDFEAEKLVDRIGAIVGACNGSHAVIPADFALLMPLLDASRALGTALARRQLERIEARSALTARNARVVAENIEREATQAGEIARTGELPEHAVVGGKVIDMMEALKSSLASKSPQDDSEGDVARVLGGAQC